MKPAIYRFTYSLALSAVLAGPGLAQNPLEDDFGIIDDGVPLEQLLEEDGEAPLPEPLPYDDTTGDTGAAPGPAPGPATGPAPAGDTAAPTPQPAPQAAPSSPSVLDALAEGVAVIAYSEPPADWVAHEFHGFTFAVPPDWKVVVDEDDTLLVFGGDMEAKIGPVFGLIIKHKRFSRDEREAIVTQSKTALADGSLFDDTVMQHEQGGMDMRARLLMPADAAEDTETLVIMMGQYGAQVLDPVLEQILATVKTRSANMAEAPTALNGLVSYRLPEGWLVEENADHTLLTLRAEPYTAFLKIAIGAGVTGPGGLDQLYTPYDPQEELFMGFLAERYTDYSDFGFVSEDGRGVGDVHYYRLHKCLPDGAPIAIAIGGSDNFVGSRSGEDALLRKVLLNLPEGSSDCYVPVAQNEPAPEPQPAPEPAPVVSPAPEPQPSPAAPTTVATQGMIDVEGVTFRLPNNWRASLDNPDDKIFESPDGRFSVLAFWWFPDEPLLGGIGEQVAQVIIEREPVTRISRLQEARPSIMNVTERARADGRRFIFTVELNSGSLEDLRWIHDALVASLSYGTVFGDGGQGAPVVQPAPQPPVAQTQPEIVARDWRPFETFSFGTRITYPANLFRPDSLGQTSDGQSFSGPGGAGFDLWASFNLDGMTPVQMAQHIQFIGEYDRIVSQQTGPDWFAFTATRGTNTIYRRGVFDQRQGVVHEVQITYPSGAAQAWAPVVKRMGALLDYSGITPQGARINPPTTQSRPTGRLGGNN